MATLGGVGMWSVVVALPRCRRASALTARPHRCLTRMTMVGFGLGRHPDGATEAIATGSVCRWRVRRSRWRQATCWPSLAPTLVLYALAQGLLIGFLGSSATFGPLLADISHWFEKRRGLAVANRRLRQLPGRHDLGRRSAGTDRNRRLAPDALHHRRRVPADDAAAHAGLAAPSPAHNGVDGGNARRAAAA